MLIKNRFRKYWLMSVEDEGEGDGDDTGDTGGGAGAGEAEGAAGEGGADTGGEAKGYWPDDWQSRFAGDDPKELKRLGRYASPEAIYKSYRAMETKLSSGQVKPTLSDKPSDEEIAEYRKNWGIPEEVTGYKLDGIEIGEDDKPVIDDFLAHAHKSNFTPDQAKAAVEWMKKNEHDQLAAREETDSEQKQETLDELNVEWGASFRRNATMVQNLLSKFPESVREDFKSARLPDGRAIFNSPDVMRAFADLALELNPAGTLTPVDGDPMKGVVDEIADLEKFMNENRKAYDKDETKQARLRELYGIREKMEQRKAG